jgi:alpha-L-fucosidase
MFLHWGLYSIPARGEWLMAVEGIPREDYEKLAPQFQPHPGAAAQWARVARQAGMKYMVLTTKHHEGFCLFHSELTEFCATKTGPRRDLVREYVEAARAEGMRVGFYFSLMDWHHPDGISSAKDPEARERFVAFVHGQVRELLTNYGRIDVLWYDMAYPLDAAGFESEKLNRMAMELQPDLVINNRSGFAGDFVTPENKIQSADSDWETCMTLNDNWGFHRADRNWKSAAAVVGSLAQCGAGAGNLLLNVGPHQDGTLPEAAIATLTEVGAWVRRNEAAVRGTVKSHLQFSACGLATVRGNTAYLHAKYWLPPEMVVPGVAARLRSARILSTGASVRFDQDARGITLKGLPAQAPDPLVPVIELAFDAPPRQVTLAVKIIDDVLKMDI